MPINIKYSNKEVLIVGKVFEVWSKQLFLIDEHYVGETPYFRFEEHVGQNHKGAIPDITRSYFDKLTAQVGNLCLKYVKSNWKVKYCGLKIKDAAR